MEAITEGGKSKRKKETVQERKIPQRHLVIGFTFMLSLLLYVDRICVSAAKDPITQTLGFTDIQMGWILSVFALGYAIFQSPAGIMADTYGPRKMLASIVSIWSFLTAITGLAWNFASMLVIRFLFGASEAGAFPGMSKVIFSWIPVAERGVTQGINFSGSRLGAAFALPLVAWLIDMTGWQNSFFILGVIGVIWSVSWYVWFTDNPADHKNLSDGEKSFILKNRQQETIEEAAAKISFKALMGSRNMWLLIFQYFASNFTFFFCLTWLYPHLLTTYSLDPIEAGIYSSAPLLVGALGNWFSGWWVDKIYKRGQWTRSRKLPAMVGFMLAALGLMGGIYIEQILPAVIFLSIAIFGADMTLSPSWTVCIDIGRKSSGLVSGTMNMAGNLGAFLTALAFPYLQALTGSVLSFFLIGAVFNLISVYLWWHVKPEEYIREPVLTN